jgi:hypothetical protein
MKGCKYNKPMDNMNSKIIKVAHKIRYIGGIVAADVGKEEECKLLLLLMLAISPNISGKCWIKE